MTVIAWDGKTLAVDCMACLGDGFFETEKIFQITKTKWAATTGVSSISRQQVNWLKKKAEYPKMDKENFSRLIVAESGKRSILIYEETEHPVECMSPYMAFGSGCEFAKGAMAMGADAVKAVQIASELCVSCGCGVVSIDVNS